MVSEEGSPTSESVTASLHLASHYRHQLQRFSDHLLILTEIFFFEDRRHEDLFHLSIRLLSPVVPFTDLEQEAAQNRFVRLVKSFEQACQDELGAFEQETEEVRKLYRSLISAEERRWRDAEARRQDEFIALSQLCRREVSAVVARVKCDTAQTTTELEALETLKVTLQAKSDEVEALQHHIQGMVKANEDERKQWLAEIARERESARALVMSDREHFTVQLQEQVRQAEADRAKHHGAVLEQHRKHVDQMEAVRARLIEQQDENDKLGRKVDEICAEHQRELRMHAEERNRLTRMITDLEISYESLKRNLQDVETDAKLNHMSLEHMTETRKLLEIQNFKKRLADTTKLLATSRASPSGSVSPRTPRSGNVYTDPVSSLASPRYHSHRAESILSNHTIADSSPCIASAPPPYREPSVSILRSVGGHSSTAYRDRSRSPGVSSIQLRSPSDTFVRLSNISRQINVHGVSSPSTT